MQTIHLADGTRLEAPPLRLGVGVTIDLAGDTEHALRPALLDGEPLLAIVEMVPDSAWQMLFVLSRHHFSRVAWAPARDEARVLTVAFEHIRGGLLDLRLADDSRVLLGRGRFREDLEAVNAAQEFLRLPPGSDGRTVLTEREACRQHVWSRPEA